MHGWYSVDLLKESVHKRNRPTLGAKRFQLVERCGSGSAFREKLDAAEKDGIRNRAGDVVISATVER